MFLRILQDGGRERQSGRRASELELEHFLAGRLEEQGREQLSSHFHLENQVKTCSDKYTSREAQESYIESITELSNHRV